MFQIKQLTSSNIWLCSTPTASAWPSLTIEMALWLSRTIVIRWRRIRSRRRRRPWTVALQRITGSLCSSLPSRCRAWTSVAKLERKLTRLLTIRRAWKELSRIRVVERSTRLRGCRSRIKRWLKVMSIWLMPLAPVPRATTGTRSSFHSLSRARNRSRNTRPSGIVPSTLAPWASQTRRRTVAQATARIVSTSPQWVQLASRIPIPRAW